MMQSLLLNGAANIKSNDLKNKDENDIKINALNNSKLTEQQRNFAKVMQDNIDKSNARYQSRLEARAQELNNDKRIENTNNNEQNEISGNKTVNASHSSQKVNDREQDIKLVSVDNKEAAKDKNFEGEKTPTKSGQGEESKLGQLKSEIFDDLAELEIDGTENSKLVSIQENEEEFNESLSSSTSELGVVLKNQADDEVFGKLIVKTAGDSEAKNSELIDSEIEVASPDLIAMNTSSVDLITTDLNNDNLNSKGNIHSGSIVDPMEQSSLLSQIEAAQQADTEVNTQGGEASSEISISMLNNQSTLMNGDEKKVPLISDGIDVEPSLEAEGKSDNKAKLVSDIETELKTKSNADLEMLVDSETEKKTKVKLEANVHVVKEKDNAESTPDVDAASQPLKATEKLDQVSTLIKSETAIANQTAIDVNGARPNQTNQVQLDKLVAFNQQAPAANNLLQAPLDIQSKHAAAMLGERVMMMMSQGKQEVEIRLDPAELGSMQIKMQVKQDQVQLHIQTQAGLSKDIIEQNMPRLREQLAQQGIQLSEANVQQQSQQQSQQQRQTHISGSSKQFAHEQEAINDQKNVFIPSKIPSQEQGIDYYV